MSQTLRHAFCLLALALPALAAEAPLWLRQPAISPDGSQIAFSAYGEICLVSAAGGEARVLTRDESRDGQPVWSPDGRSLVFASDRNGNADLYRLDIASGVQQRLTWHSASDTPWFVDGDSRVWFSSSRGENQACAIFPTRRFDELYSVALDGSELRRELNTPAHHPSRRADGAMLYQDVHSFEDDFRKHHHSSATRDIWLAPADGTEHRRITHFAGEDLDACWLPDGQHYAFLSERGGTLNVWKANPDSDEATALTSFADYPVRSLSCASTGRLCFSRDGALYVLDAGGEARRLQVSIPLSARSSEARVLQLHEGARGAVLSPDGSWIAFTVRGELYICSTAHGSTRRLTSTGWEERDPCFSPTGDSLVFVSREPGNWRMKLAHVDADLPGNWLEQASIPIDDFGPAGETPLAPRFSPDGTRVAYVSQRCAVHQLELAGMTVSELMPYTHGYTYTDDGNRLRWSPDGRWIVMEGLDSLRWSYELQLLESRGTRRINLSDSGYEEFQPLWSEDGQRLYSLSDRSGLKAHGGGGGSTDIWMMALSDSAWWKHGLDPERYEFLFGDQEDDHAEEPEPKNGKPDKHKSTRNEKKPSAPAETGLNLVDAHWRIDRITQASSDVADFVLLEDGERVLSLARFEAGYDLWETRPRQGEMELLASLGLESGGSLALDADQAFVYVLTSDEGFLKVDVESGDVEPVGWSAEFRLDQAAEWRAELEHVRVQVRDRFYDSRLHGVDWDALCDHYARFLPSIDTKSDFAELLSELLGELNASHTGAFTWIRQPGADDSAELGLFLSPTADGRGLRIDEVLRDGPFDVPGITPATGSLLLSMDGQAVSSEQDIWKALNRRAGAPVAVTLLSGKTETSLTVRPWSGRDQRQALYDRWVRRNEQRVDTLSNGRLGYVHIRAMDDDSFRRLYDKALGPFSARDALIVDTRSNGGGNLAEDLVQFFGGKRLFRSTVPPDNRILGDEPWTRWNRPVIVLMDESNYSDSHIFPASMRAMGMAELVGMPVAGTGTAVWWEDLIDGETVFGIPEVGFIDNQGRYLENQQLEPDLKVDNPPLALAAGRDLQLEAAVKRMLEILK